MDHPDWPAFVSAILADPNDDTVRLVAADFLEEHGDPDRAAFIRVQCEIARLEREGGGWHEINGLRTKEHTYLGPLSHFRLLWAAEACPELVVVKPPPRGASPLALPQVEGADRLVWRRGFVDEVRCPALEWLRHGAAVRRRQPVAGVLLHRCQLASRDHWYAHLEALRGLAWVRLDEFYEDWLGQWLPGTEVSGPF